MKEENENNTKLYSHTGIAIATYFGGPLAAGVLVRKNSINLGKKRQGLYALIIGIVSTILLFIGIFQIPENIIDKVPNAIIPFVYTGIIYLIVEKIHGDKLKKQKQEGEFYSNWKATGIGLVCSVILVGGIFAFAYFQPQDWDADKYDTGIEQYNNNEAIAMKLFDMLDNNSQQEIAYFIEHTGIPKWKESIQIMNEINSIENIPVEFQKQNRLLLEYSQLRIEAYELISKAVLEETSEYDSEIIQRHTRIDKIISQL